MSLVFEPTGHFGGSGTADCRIALVRHYHHAKSADAKSMGLDIRISEQAARDWGLRSGDRVTARRDDDGTWWFQIVLPTQRGFVIRIGGTKHHQGRKGCAYFRIAVTPATGRTLFPDSERVMELDLVGVEGRSACFSPARVSNGMEFVPNA